MSTPKMRVVEPEKMRVVEPESLFWPPLLPFWEMEI
jgi:hypothetical protein